MKRAIIFAVLVVACKDTHQQTIDEMHARTVNLTRENATLKAKAEKAEQLQAALATEAADLRSKLKIAELRAMTTSLPVEVNSAIGSGRSDESQGRGGFTDFGQSVKKAPDVPATTPTTRPATPQRASAPPPSGPDYNAVATASDFYGANDVMQRKCSAEWPGDARMFDHCMGRQAEGLGELKRGRPFGMDEKTFNEARVRCASEWPGDYAMRAYCEGKARR